MSIVATAKVISALPATIINYLFQMDCLSLETQESLGIIVVVVSFIHSDFELLKLFSCDGCKSFQVVLDLDCCEVQFLEGMLLHLDL